MRKQTLPFIYDDDDEGEEGAGVAKLLVIESEEE